MKRLMMILVLLAGPAWASAADEITPGQLYSGGHPLKASGLGLEFTVPSGWQALLPAGAEIMVMEPLDQSARLFVMGEPDNDPASVSAAMNEATQLDAGLSIEPLAPASLSDGLYRQRYRILGPNPQGLEVSSLGRLGDNGVAVYAILMQAAGSDGRMPEVETFMRGIRFSAIAAASAPATVAGDEIDWDGQLRGRTLRYLRSGNGLTVDKRLSLCSDGMVVYSDRDSYFSGGAISDFSAYSNSGDVGRWRIDGNRLGVTWNDGSRSDYTLSRRYVERWDEWGTFLNEDRWFNIANEVCQ